MFLSFESVTKFYGPVIGVNDVSCRIGPGITGLLGANGAGKSTLIKLASGQLRPSLGRVRVGDHPAWSAAAKQGLGYSPDINSFYEEMTGREFVYVLARLHGMTRRQARERTEHALSLTGMAPRAHRRIAGCSHGMRQRIKLAQALVHNPQVLLLDEPLSGIDPGGRKEINSLMETLAAEGKTILFSSHILTEVEQLADSILIISAGRIMASGTLSEVRALIEDQPFTVEIVTPQARELASVLAGWEAVQTIELRSDGLQVRTRQPGRFFSELNRVAMERPFDLRRIETLDSGADAVFDYLQSGR